MKLVSYTRSGVPGFGAVVEGGVVDLTGRLNPRVTTLKAALTSYLLSRAESYVRDRVPEINGSDLSLLPVIPDPAKILCIGLNYEEHKAESKRPDVEHPTVFTRFEDTPGLHLLGRAYTQQWTQRDCDDGNLSSHIAFPDRLYRHTGPDHPDPSPVYFLARKTRALIVRRSEKP